MEPVTPEATNAPATSLDPSHTKAASEAKCSCAPQMPLVEQYVYAIGSLDVRFPSLGIEREYQQRERAIDNLPPARGGRIRAVIERNPHLGLRIGYVFVIGGSPAFALTPATGSLRESFLTAISQMQEPEHSCVVIGRVGTFTNPAAFGGLLLPTVSVDQLYVFSAKDWQDELSRVAQPALESRKIDAKQFKSISRTMFREMTSMPENVGVSDGHRALNYLLVQHPGIFLAATERSHHVLDRIETRPIQASGGRRHIAVILSFLDRGTGVPERMYCTVDVTEEWPFVVSAEGALPALGLAPYVENVMYGSV